MSYSTILFEIKEQVAIIRLNLPKQLNALTNQMIDDLMGACERITESQEIRAAVITGMGKGCCAGGELEELKTC